MPTKIIGTCSLCQGPVAVIDPWMGTYPCVPTCQNCGARKKDAFGPVIEMVPHKGLPGTILPIDPTKINNPIDWKLGNPTCGQSAVILSTPDNKKAFVEALQEAIDATKNRTT